MIILFEKIYVLFSGSYVKVYRIKSIADFPYLNRVKNINIKSWNQNILVQMNLERK